HELGRSGLGQFAYTRIVVKCRNQDRGDRVRRVGEQCLPGEPWDERRSIAHPQAPCPERVDVRLDGDTVEGDRPLEGGGRDRQGGELEGRTDHEEVEDGYAAEEVTHDLLRV